MSIYNTNIEYSESKALEALLNDLDDALKNENERMEENGDADYDDIKIIVNGKVHAFLLGGPQSEGIWQFAKQIADENAYEIKHADGANVTVTE